MQLGIRQKSAAASPLAIFVHQHLNSLRMSSQNFAHRSPPPGSSRSMIGRGHRFSSGLDGVRWELGQVLDDISTEEGVVGDVVLVQERSLGWLDADEQLLAEVAPSRPAPTPGSSPPALSKVSMIAAHDLGKTWIVCLFTASRRL